MGAAGLITEYKETISFAKLGQPAILPPQGEGEGELKPPPKPRIDVGDLIQVEIGGALAIENPTRVRAIQEHEGRSFVFIDGTETGFPVEQAILEKKGEPADKLAVSAPRLPLEPPPPAGIRKEVFALDEGDVVLTFPENFCGEFSRP